MTPRERRQIGNAVREAVERNAADGPSHEFLTVCSDVERFLPGNTPVQAQTAAPHGHIRSYAFAYGRKRFVVTIAEVE